MPTLIVSCLSLLLVLASCAAEVPAPKGPWSLKLTTSGGFAGVGTGNISVDSEGKFTYEEPMPPSPPAKKGCSGKLDASQLRTISEAVAQSNPNGWNRPGLDVAAPDAFGYKLELRMPPDAQPVTAKWYDNTTDQLPADLKRLSDVLGQTMKSVCKP